MSTAKVPFRARDDKGSNYDVIVYVYLTPVAPRFGGVSPPVETFSHAKAKAISGPYAGETFPVTRIDDDTFDGPGFRLIRVR